MQDAYHCKTHTGFGWEEVMERDYLKDPGVDGRIILNFIFKKWNREAWSGLIWLKIGTGGRRS